MTLLPGQLFFINKAYEMSQLRVCVIGAGAAGLAAARHLTSELDVFDVRVYDQASRVGGIWVYSENTGPDERGIPVHSSIYRNLRYSVSFLLIHTLKKSVLFSATVKYHNPVDDRHYVTCFKQAA